MSAMLDFAEYHDWIICVQKFAKKWFSACMPASFLQISGTYGTSHAGTIYLWYGLGHNIIWIYACDQSRKYVNHVMLWLCYITVPWEFPGGSQRRFPERPGNSYYLHIDDQGM